MALHTIGGRVAATAVVMSAVFLAPIASQTGVSPRPVAGVTPPPSSEANEVEFGPGGLREPAWSPDGGRLAVVFLDRLWTVGPDGRDAKAIAADAASVQREPAWSPRGDRIAFAMDCGDGFDVYAADVASGAVERVTRMPGEERAPSWTPDGRVVFSHRAPGDPQWDLFIVGPAEGRSWPDADRLTGTDDSEVQPRVAPDGRHVAFASDRDSEEGDFDLWVMRLPAARDRARPGGEGDGRTAPLRVQTGRGLDGYPSWSPDGTRLAYYAVRDGLGGTWVAPVDALRPEDGGAPRRRMRPSPPPMLVSRHAGTVAWSPDGRTLAIGELPDPEPGYNGNPHREAADPPPLFGLGRAYRIWTVPAPRPIDEDARPLAPAVPPRPAALTGGFDRVWATLERLYYQTGAGAAAWDALRAKYRPQAERARTEEALEDVTDAMLAEAPLIKPEVASSRAVVVSGHPLASEAGRQVLEKGGNVVDAMIAVAFALGVVEPDASGIGGDGQAVLYLRGMPEPTVVEYKDQTPGSATLDNPKIFRDGRIVADGPAAANVPGVVAGLDYLFTRYGSGRVKWADLVEPAILYAKDGFTLDEALPSSVAEARQLLEKYPAAARIYLPDGRIPRAGETFVNADYARTLRTIAAEGAASFYRGSIARSIAADMDAHGGLITLEDLAQYHAVERRPVSAGYRGYRLYTGGPPVASGVSLLEALQIFGNYPASPGATPATDAEYWHYLIESWKAREPVRRVADPAYWPVDYERHLQPSHASARYGRIRRDTAAPYRDEDETADERIGRGTTAFVIADADGNMIAATHTLSSWGGAFYVSRGLGFLYNNHLRSSRAARGVYGQLMPRTRSTTTSVPTLVFRQDGTASLPFLAMGAAGNAWISSSAYSILTGVIDGGLTIQRAIEAPRFLVTRDPSDPFGTAARIDIEDRFPRPVLASLMARGHRFHKIGRKGEVRYGYAAAAVIDPVRGRVEGGSEPRRSHRAVAVGPVSSTAQ